MDHNFKTTQESNFLYDFFYLCVYLMTNFHLNLGVGVGQCRAWYKITITCSSFNLKWQQ